MRRKIPSTAALTAFESAARHQSYTKAADELAVTQSAVCRQIAGLEDFLGVRLFRRSRRGVALTDAGLAYSRVVASRLDDVERDTLELMARGAEGGTLELGVVPTFATKWLLPRLPSFMQRHPGVRVHLTSRTRPFLFDDSGMDAAIHAGEAKWPGTEGVFLLPEQLIAVCSPRLIAPKASLARADWRRLPLLQQSTRPYVWRQWFASLGLEVEGDLAGPRLELFSMLTEAAIHGIGIALIPPFLVEDELRRGLLVQASTHTLRSDRSYHLIYPEGKAENAALAAFRAWIVEQAQGSASAAPTARRRAHAR
ncbi:MAG TPA: LysR family transcriptional regulator [Burkholderiaceae bacterium]